MLPITFRGHAFSAACTSVASGMASDSPLRRLRPFSLIRHFLHTEAPGGLILMAAAALALVVANSPLAVPMGMALALFVGKQVGVFPTRHGR